MPHVKALVSLPHTGGIAENVVVNTFHFQTDAGDQAAALAEIADELEAFYLSSSQPSQNTLTQFLSASLATTGSTIKLYNMADLIPRPPVLVRTFDLGPTAGSNLPREVALCLSFQAVLLAGFPQARRRGRVYIGPFGTSASNYTAGDARPSQSLIDTLKERGARLSNSLEFSDWSVFSTISGALLPVANGWVDNAFDTQRRRGLDPNTRNVWS